MQVKYAFLHFSYAAPVRVSDMDIAATSAFVAARAADGAMAPRDTVVVRSLFFADVSRAVCGVALRDTALRADDAALPRGDTDDCTDAARDVVVIVRGVNTDVRGASVFSVVAAR